MVCSDYAKSRGTKVIHKIFKRVKKRTKNQIKTISTDGWVTYPNVIKNIFGENKIRYREGNLIPSKKGAVVHKVVTGEGNFNYKIERFHNTLRQRTKIMRGFHGRISSAQSIMKGYEIYYNWIRQHQGLKGLTPSDLAIPKIQLQNKNRWIEIIERGYGK